MSRKPTDTGKNRTGASMSPIDSKKTADGATDSMPNRTFDMGSIKKVRVGISKVAEPVGTMPPPATVKGAAVTAFAALKGKNPNVFLDMLAQRLAFERSGVRLYEGLLIKFDAASVPEQGVAREDLEKIRDEELEHFGMLCDVMRQLGGDPTALTPAANVTAVATEGFLKALADPRTTFTECLDVMLAAELTDNAAWLMLADLAAQIGMDEVAEKFRRALSEEEEHLARIRHWLMMRIDGQLGVQRTHPAPAGMPPPPP